MAPRPAPMDAVRMMIGRATVRLVTQADGVQRLQLEGLADEVLEEIERHQDYGFNSHPLDGASAVTLALGGTRGRSMAVAVGDRRYRMELEAGEVAISDDQGQKVHLTRDGIVVETAKSITLQAGEEVIVQAPKLTAMIDGEAKVTCETATIDASGDALLKAAGTAKVQGATVHVIGDDVRLGGTGGAKVALVGDTVAGGVITGPGATKVRAT